MNLNDLLAQGQKELNELREKERIEAEQRRQDELARIEADRKAWESEVKRALPEDARPYIVAGERPSNYQETMIRLNVGDDFFPINAIIGWLPVYNEEDRRYNDDREWRFIEFVVPWIAQTGNYIFYHGDVFQTQSFPLALAVAKERWEQWNTDENAIHRMGDN